MQGARRDGELLADHEEARSSGHDFVDNGERQYVPRDPTKTVLYGLVAEQRATFCEGQERGRWRASFVDQSLERLPLCGVLAHGFARSQCDTCQHDHFVPLSRKARGLCPSCGGRRMIALTRHIMDAEFPHVPTHQWVLSLPLSLRHKLACD